MAKLSKREMAAHREAEALLQLDRLNDDQRQFVLDNWHEGAEHMQGAAGAFFTPSQLALDAALMGGCCRYGDDEPPYRVLDLCAGIGALGLAAWWRSGKTAQVTCIEKNPAYVAIGKRLFPEARWICASVDQLPTGLGRFDLAIANPPFGTVAKIKGPRFSGCDELAVLDIASDHARRGIFILPQMSCPFEYSGRRYYERRHSEKFARFHKLTGIDLECESIDSSYFRDQWKGVCPIVEVASCEFAESAAVRAASDLPLFQLIAA